MDVLPSDGRSLFQEVTFSASASSLLGGDLPMQIGYYFYMAEICGLAPRSG